MDQRETGAPDGELPAGQDVVAPSLPERLAALNRGIAVALLRREAEEGERRDRPGRVR